MIYVEGMSYPQTIDFFKEKEVGVKAEQWMNILRGSVWLIHFIRLSLWYLISYGEIWFHTFIRNYTIFRYFYHHRHLLLPPLIRRTSSFTQHHLPCNKICITSFKNRCLAELQRHECGKTRGPSNILLNNSKLKGKKLFFLI